MTSPFANHAPAESSGPAATPASIPQAAWVLASLLALAGLWTGCASREDKLREALRAREQHMQGQMERLEQQQPAVFFRGDVRNPRVPWKEGLTLAEALATAQYTWTWDPHQITVTRNGESFAVNPRRLLRGQENPELEPGDVVEVRH